MNTNSAHTTPAHGPQSIAVNKGLASAAPTMVPIQHISPVTLLWLDEFIGRKQAENGGYCDIQMLFRGKDEPIVIRETTEYKPYLHVQA